MIHPVSRVEKSMIIWLSVNSPNCFIQSGLFHCLCLLVFLLFHFILRSARLFDCSELSQFSLRPIFSNASDAGQRKCNWFKMLKSLYFHMYLQVGSHHCPIFHLLWSRRSEVGWWRLGLRQASPRNLLQARWSAELVSQTQIINVNNILQTLIFFQGRIKGWSERTCSESNICGLIKKISFWYDSFFSPQN